MSSGAAPNRRAWKPVGYLDDRLEFVVIAQAVEVTDSGGIDVTQAGASAFLLPELPSPMRLGLVGRAQWPEGSDEPIQLAMGITRPSEPRKVYLGESVEVPKPPGAGASRIFGCNPGCTIFESGDHLLYVFLDGAPAAVTKLNFTELVIPDTVDFEV